MLKALILSALLSVSAKALACPDLVGVYTCKLTSQIMELEIQQTKTAFSVRMNAETNRFSNDKITKVERVTQFGIETTKSQTGSCTENSITATTVITQQNEIQKLSSDITIVLEKTSATTANLKFKALTYTDGVLDEEGQIDATVPCIKK